MQEDMKGFVHQTVRLIRVVEKIYEKKWSFFALAVLVFVFSVSVLAQFDLLPDSPTQLPTVVSLTAISSPLISSVSIVSTPSLVSQNPVEITIPAIGLSTTIANPHTTNIEALDKMLLSGAVRYPTSAQLNENGNVVLFGHSSYLPIVANQAYKTFNGIQKLKTNNIITVYSADTVYTYAVRDVSKKDATSDVIPLSVSGKVLTLSTCDSFGAKTDRFVVTADFVESHPIST